MNDFDKDIKGWWDYDYSKSPPTRVYSVLEQHRGEIRPKESRSFPQYPLKSMTRRSRVFRRKMRKPVALGYDTLKANLMTVGYEDSYVLPNWALDLRLEAQSLRTNLSSAVAEWDKSISGFVALAQSLRNIRRNILSRKPRINLCDVSSGHLAYHFGVKPVVSDAYNTFKELLNNDDPKPIRIAATSAKILDTSKSTTKLIYKGTAKCTTRATAHFKPDFSGAGNLDLGNPIEWAWELTPFSFVIDWMIPIGDYLTSLFALTGLTLYGKVSLSIMVKGNHSVAVNPDYKEPKKTGFYNYVSHERKIFEEIPLPEFPEISPTKSFLALAHAVALLHQLRKCR